MTVFLIAESYVSREGLQLQRDGMVQRKMCPRYKDAASRFLHARLTSSTSPFISQLLIRQHFTSPTMSSTQAQDTKKLWQDPGIAARYANAENATRPFAKILMEKAGVSTLDKSANVFDLATGTGAAVQELYDAVPKVKWGSLKVLGTDVSEDMLTYLDARREKEGWEGLETRVLDGNVRLFRFTSHSLSLSFLK
jgi:hypothetical protein